VGKSTCRLARNNKESFSLRKKKKGGKKEGKKERKTENEKKRKERAT